MKIWLVKVKLRFGRNIVVPKVEFMIYPLWCLLCAAFCLWAPVAFGPNTVLTLLGAGVGAFGWACLAIKSLSSKEKEVNVK